MRLPQHWLFTTLLALLVGCTSSSKGTAPGLIVLVPGVAGDGSWYRHLVPTLRAAGDRRTVASFGWGVGGPGFMMNFNNKRVHADAERKFADYLTEYRRTHPADPIDVVAHSAGGGVTLGALALLPADVKVREVILLHPSVSPSYPLRPALAAVGGSLHLFHSGRDTTFLSWRTGNFGTYDNVKTKAAGNVGFDLAGLDPHERARVIMHRHEDGDRSLGNDGGHFGALARPFLGQRVVPLIATASPAPAEPSR